MKRFALLLFLVGNPCWGEPIETREWQATSGHKTQARALSASASTVTLELASGKTIELTLDKLVPADREVILSHFKIEPPKEGDPIRSDAKPLKHEDLSKVTGPIKRQLLWEKLPRSGTESGEACRRIR